MAVLLNRFELYHYLQDDDDDDDDRLGKHHNPLGQIYMAKGNAGKDER